MPFTGTQRPRVAVWVMTNGEDLMVESVIARHEDVDRVPAVMRHVLMPTGAREGVTLLSDTEGNYVARSHLAMESLDVSTFRSSVQAIVAAADTAYGAFKGWLSEYVDAGECSRPSPVRSGLPPGATRHLRSPAGQGLAYSFNPALERNPIRRSRQADISIGRRERLRDGRRGGPVTIPLAQLRDRALANMRQTGERHPRRGGSNDGTSTAPRLLSLKTNVTVQGIPFTYLGDHDGGPSGTVQVVTYTERGKFQEYQRQFEEFLNGLRVGQ